MSSGLLYWYWLLCKSSIVHRMYTLLSIPRNQYYFQKIHSYTHAKFAIFFTYLIILITLTFSFIIVNILTSVFNTYPASALFRHNRNNDILKNKITSRTHSLTTQWLKGSHTIPNAICYYSAMFPVSFIELIANHILFLNDFLFL